MYNDQNNNDFTIIINRRTYLKNAKNIWMEVSACKTNKNEAKKLH